MPPSLRYIVCGRSAHFGNKLFPLFYHGLLTLPIVCLVLRNSGLSRHTDRFVGQPSFLSPPLLSPSPRPIRPPPSASRTNGHTRTNKQPQHTHILTDNEWKIFRNKLARAQCQLINSLNSIAYKQQVELVRNYVIFEIRFPKYCCAYSFHIHRRAVLALARTHTHAVLIHILAMACCHSYALTRCHQMCKCDSARCAQTESILTSIYTYKVGNWLTVSLSIRLPTHGTVV